MNNRSYSVGKSTESWRAETAQTITFIVTHDCNLRCKYCYVTHKSTDKKMNFETAKEFIDYLLTTKDGNLSEAVILEFIGGEPFMEVALIDRICDYFKIKAYELKHIWYWNYRINICTNGLNYSNESVQNFIDKNYNKISVSITVDGTKQKHDLQRVLPNGAGSYDIIEKNIELWLSKFSGDTKVTFSSDDLPFLKDSVISLWNKGINVVNANVVFEDVWKDGDDLILENQLKDLADYIIDNNLFNSNLYCSFFDDSIGCPYDKNDIDSTFCGAGKMMALGPDGVIYPCIRYYEHSLNNHPSWPVGSVKSGFNMEKIRPFILASNRIQSDKECLECDIASGCAFCQGFNYDDSVTGTNSHRAKYICKMHKARVRANEYYFAKLFNIYGIDKDSHKKESSKQLYFLLSDDYTSYCSYSNINDNRTCMNKSDILDGLKYAAYNFYKPIFVHSKSCFEFEYLEEYNAYDIVHIVPAKFIKDAIDSGIKRIIPVFDKDNIDYDTFDINNVILNVLHDDINNLYNYTTKLLNKVDRININILNINNDFNEELYKEELIKLSNYLYEFYKNNNYIKEVNIITDLMYLDTNDNCKAGDKSFVIAPSSKIYTCCAQYSNYSDEFIGDLEKGIYKEYDARLYKLENSNICSNCDAYQCKNCVFVNKLSTNEINVSPSFQCRKSHIERLASKLLFDKLTDEDKSQIKIQKDSIKEINYLDPAEEYINSRSLLMGYYKFKNC